MFILRLTVMICLLAACTHAVVVSEREPAEGLEYRSCQPVVETMIQVRAVDYNSLEKNFKNVKDNVFKNHCASCHFGPDAYKPQLDDYTATLEYVDLNSLEESRLLQSVENGTMPPSYPLTNRSREAVAFLRAWVLEGANR